MSTRQPEEPPCWGCQRKGNFQVALASSPACCKEMVVGPPVFWKYQLAFLERCWANCDKLNHLAAQLGSSYVIVSFVQPSLKNRIGPNWQFRTFDKQMQMHHKPSELFRRISCRLPGKRRTQPHLSSPTASQASRPKRGKLDQLAWDNSGKTPSLPTGLNGPAVILGHLLEDWLQHRILQNHPGHRVTGQRRLCRLGDCGACPRRFCRRSCRTQGVEFRGS